MWLLLLALLAVPRPAQADNPSQEDLTFSEKQSMPAWLYADYVSEMKRLGRDGAPIVVDRFRKILQAMDKLPPAKRDELVAEGSRAQTRQRRDELVLNYTGLETRPGPENGLPRSELSDFERDGQLPEGLGQDYRADMAAAKDPNTVVSLYRRIIEGFNALSDARKKDFADKLKMARSRAERDELVARYTGVQSAQILKTIHISNDSADVTLTLPQFHPNPETSVKGDLKAGMFAPFGGTGDTNSVLKESPYVQAALTGAYDGAVKAMMTVTGNLSYLQSQKIFSSPGANYGPNGLFPRNDASNAGMLTNQTQFGQPFFMGSAYADIGTVTRFGPDVRAAFYAAGDALIYQPTAYNPDNANPTVPVISLTAGTMWMVKRAHDEWSAFTDVRLQGVSANTLTYGTYTVAPSVGNGVEYAHTPNPSERFKVGAESLVGPGQGGIRPYVGYESGKVSGLVAGDFQASRNDFIPSTAGGGLKVGWQATPFMKVGLEGSLEDQKYSMAPGGELAYTGRTTLDFNIDKATKVRADLRAPDVYSERNPIPSAGRLNEYVTDSPYSKVDFLDALKKSGDLNGFAKAVGATSLNEILSALSALDFNLNKWNYNYSNTGWAGTDEEIYANARNAILSQKKDPDLQCVGGETFISAVANAMGKAAGVPIEAAASSVEVPSSNGSQDTHFVALIKTQQYGIVFLDWGQLTPTYQFDTRKALDIFQGLQGIPQIAHYIADSSGHFGGYLFSEDGKALVENGTYHDQLPSSDLHQMFRDDPESASITEGRYKKMLQDMPPQNGQ